MAFIPLRYSVRNIGRRKTRSFLTVLGLGFALGIVVFMLAFSRSLTTVIRHTGDSDNIVIISKKAETHALSSIAARECDQIRAELFDEAATFSRPGASGVSREPLISLEVYIGLNVRLPNQVADPESPHRAVLHGVDPPLAMQVNRSVQLVAGRLPAPGKLELLCGSTTYARIGVAADDLRIGSKLRLLNGEWTVVGRFEAPGTLMDSEIWTHVNDLRVYLKRTDYSFIRVKLKDPSAMSAIVDRISTDEQFGVKAFPEQTYFADYGEGFEYFGRFAHLLTVLIVAGGVVAGMNTMYTAVMGRVREIGTLQVIGYSKASVLVCILVESTIISFVGGVLGCGLGFLANGLSVKIPMAAFRVQVDAVVVLWAMLVAIAIGLCGAIVPAYRALKLRMVDAVRYE